MKIYDTTDTMAILWELFKDLGIPVYKQSMDEDENSTPQTYLVIRSDVTNSASFFGDGEPQIRKSTCDIILVAQGAGRSDSDFAINCNKIEGLLDGTKLSYTGHNLGYNDSLKASEYSWSVNVLYD